MRFALLLVLAAACSAGAEPVAAPASAPVALDVAFVDTVDGAPTTHLAVGGKLRVRLPDAATSASTVGPFAVAIDGDHAVIRATGEGSGVVDIDTAIGTARIAVSAAPIASVGIVPVAPNRATIALRDASGKRLVDASLRVASGSAPVTFDRETWDRVELASVDNVLVKTDLLGTTRGVIEWSCGRDAVAINR